MIKRKFAGYAGVLLLREYVNEHGDGAVHEFLAKRNVQYDNKEERDRVAGILLAAEKPSD